MTAGEHHTVVYIPYTCCLFQQCRHIVTTMETTLSLVSPEGAHGPAGGSVGEAFQGLVCGVLGGVSRTQVSLLPSETPLSSSPPSFAPSYPAASDSVLYKTCVSCTYFPPMEKSRVRKFPLGPNLCYFWQGLAWGLGSDPGKFPPNLYNASRLTLFFSSGVLNFSTGNLENKNALIHRWLVQDTALQELPNCRKEGLEPVHRPLLDCTDKGTLICGLNPSCGCWGRGI